jgi:hypothetical protein
LDADRIAGVLLIVGGMLGLAGTVSTFFPFSVLGVVSFGLVLAFGGLVYWQRPEARLVTIATLWFAPLGGAACVIILTINYFGCCYNGLWAVQGSLGLFGMSLALAGAGIKLSKIPS